MSRLVAIAVLVTGGCFYTDPINQRPSLSIRQMTDGSIFRGETVVLGADVSDPEDQSVTVSWHAYLCTDATPDAMGAHSGCDLTAVASASITTLASDGAPFSFVVPSLRADGMTPVANVYVTLEGKDSLGAAAKPIQELVLAIVDAAPDLTLRQVSSYSYVVGMPIDLFAKVGDVDDGPTAVGAPTWQVFSPPTQPAYTIDDLVVMQDSDTTHLQYGKLFTPMDTGAWEVDVTATDPSNVATEKPFMITVVADTPPCLVEWSPIASDSPTVALPLSDPTLFQVLVVQDDLDPYPPVSDPLRGETAFSWSILPPGATSRQPLTSVTGNGVELDPGSYAPGDVVELRVEIQDRNATPVNCPDGDLTCSTISDPSCIQRLTWRVEVQ